MNKEMSSTHSSSQPSTLPTAMLAEFLLFILAPSDGAAWEPELQQLGAALALCSAHCGHDPRSFRRFCRRVLENSVAAHALQVCDFDELAKSLRETAAREMSSKTVEASELPLSEGTAEHLSSATNPRVLKKNDFSTL